VSIQQSTEGEAASREPIEEPAGLGLAARAAGEAEVVLVVDADAELRRTLGRALVHRTRRVHEAGSLAEARRVIHEEAIDLALIDEGLPDGRGVELARELSGSRPASRSIMLAACASAEGAIEAMRAGASDMVAKPLDVESLKASVFEALKEVGRDRRRRRRVAQLRKLCRRLNDARHEISQQVDILCQDLVLAYQELAGQLHCVEQTAELRTVLSSELDLEQVLRQIMQFLLDKIGPSNIIVFLPAPGEGFSVGGYVNYSFTKETIQVVTGHLAAAAAPAIADAQGVMQIDDEPTLRETFGDAAGWVTGSAVMAAPCLDADGEALAALMLFRSSDAPFDEDHAGLLEAAGPVVAAHLARVVRVHNRHTDLFDDEEGDLGLDSMPF